MAARIGSTGTPLLLDDARRLVEGTSGIATTSA